MPNIPIGRHEPDLAREPNKKPADFRATGQQQSNAGTYDDRGGGHRKKALVAVIAIVVIAIIVTTVIDAIAGRDLL